jgi:type VI secretion system secreted protein Hcp
MATNVLMKIDGIKGSSDREQDAIDVKTWNWGVAQTGYQHRTDDAGGGQATYREFEFKKDIDFATADLLSNCSERNGIGKAVLTVRTGGGQNHVDQLVLTMEKVRIAQVSMDHTNTDGLPTETVKLHFLIVKIEFQPMKDGRPFGGKAVYHWNIPNNMRP